ncbi:hypothetical protein B5V88_14465 [Heyndrickxia sporothermodurans]|uniref:FERM domain-containing protein n=1 Tax=Heyndrickxia sporothermodurans TaxID=46224 RepID=A0AB37HEP5_9BACI|nr:hypothetical protein [Heyndrickxia sporothermodurans]MBL5768117.1 hypothetical protein [Heyndrickxia sporothermodurans]MBL5771770.1 hypothetical protein [Heyndrickxia sporothermodurans]MBL5775388.1 hypothetical protein [Heyndrickxia sporothermodurans]MBL5778880.1 hypothetical protein [Heyndrickxia sporothermodurans]MBL5782486.1 hypothetical protein [Heyndrickxia sporothermodurans]
METEIANEIARGANVEKTLAKYFGLSVTKNEVQIIKKALNDRDKINHMIEVLCSRNWRMNSRIQSY